jgi:hypothetical protein
MNSTQKIEKKKINKINNISMDLLAMMSIQEH